LVEGGACSFYGVTIYFSGAALTIPKVIEIATGANKNQFHDVWFDNNDATFTNGIYNTDAANGRTGTDKYIQHYASGENANVASWYVNVETNKVLKRAADALVATGGAFTVTGDLAVSGAITEAGAPVLSGTVSGNTVPKGSGGNLVNSAITDDGVNVNVAKQSGVARLNVGDDASSASSGLNGLKVVPFSDGNNYIDSKAQNGGTTVFRCGHNTETGSARTWATLTNSSGAVAFGAAVSGAKTFSLTNEIAPAQITANQDNYNPTGFADATHLILTTDASRDLTGFANPTNGRMIWVYNNGSFNLVLKHDVTSTATNRIWGRGAADVVLTPKTGCYLYYSATITRWVVMGDTL
jgi:hypothetical protein